MMPECVEGGGGGMRRRRGAARAGARRRGTGPGVAPFLLATADRGPEGLELCLFFLWEEPGRGEPCVPPPPPPPAGIPGDMPLDKAFDGEEEVLDYCASTLLPGLVAGKGYLPWRYLGRENGRAAWVFRLGTPDWR